MVKSSMSWNGYPISIRNFLICELKTKYENYSTSTSNANAQTDENIAKIWIKIPYLGNHGENIIKSCTSKIQRFLTKPVKFIIIYDIKESHFSSQTKIKFLFYHAVILVHHLFNKKGSLEQRRLLSDWSIFPKALTDQFHFRFGKARKSRQRFKKTTRSTSLTKSAIIVRNYLCCF